MKKVTLLSVRWTLIGLAAVCYGTASADSIYVGLGDSITFGETDLNYVQSYGNRGYVADFANTLASRDGGIAPTVVNLAIDGETAASFMTGAGRTPPVVSRTDAVLAAENLNYASSLGTSQLTMFQNLAASEKAAGNKINNISITLGFNELAVLASFPTNQALSMLPSTLATYQSNYTQVLTDIRSLEPNATIYMLGYFNPFPANPTNPAAPIFAQGGPELNAIVQTLATEFDAGYVNTAPSFVGKEAALTYLGQYPARAMSPGILYAGTEPIGNVHPNSDGYQTIANDVASSPEPSSLCLSGFALVAFGAIWRNNRRKRIQSV